MNRKISVRGIAVLDGKLLCVRLKPYPGAIEGRYDFWCTPGGGVEDGERLLDACKREMVEELGAEPKIGRLLYVQQFALEDDDQDILEFFFHIENPEDYQNVDLGKTTHGEKEIAAVDFVDPASTHILPTFLTTENLPEFIASGGPVRFFTQY